MMNALKNRQNDFNRNNDIKIYIIHKKESTSQIISLHIPSYIRFLNTRFNKFPYNMLLHVDNAAVASA